MQLIFQSLIPLAFVIILGWFAGWRKIIDAKHSSSLATYVMSFSFPCLLFAKTATTSLQNLINYRFIAGLSLGLLGMYLLVFSRRKVEEKSVVNFDLVQVRANFFQLTEN